jgi:hypothetical protein
MACGRLPRVAESPHTIRFGFHFRKRANASCSCTPRLLPMSSCHSSTTTFFKPEKFSRASGRVSCRVKLSGVVMSVVGRRRDCFARSALLVSPVRKPKVQSISRSVSGASSERSVSAASARIGVSHNTVNGGASFLLPVEAADSA